MRVRGGITALILCLGITGVSLTGQKTLHVPSQYKTIAAALAVAAQGDTVLVAPGLYRENLVINRNAHVHLRSVAGPHFTIIDGGGKGPVISSPLGAGKTIEGFTIQNGFNPMRKGGGIYVGAENILVIRNNVIRNNRAGEGGGIYAMEGCPTVITGNRIQNNMATAVGGGIRLAGDGSHIYVTHNVVIGNKCTLDGGGIHSHGNGMFTIYLDHNLIVENEAGRDGGGLHSFDGHIYGNIIRGNRASRHGGGLYMPIGQIGAWGMENCTFVGNSALGGGGAVSENFDMFRPRVWTNCIFWNNRALSGPEIMVGVLKPPTWWHSWLHLDHCVVSGGLASIRVSSKSTLRWGSGMMTKDPRFVQESGGDLHLKWGSPCIDAGNPKVRHTVDFEDDPFRGVVDIGADEFAPHFYQVGEARPGQIFGLRMIGTPGHRVYWGASANLRSPPLKIPGAGSLHLREPFLAWPGGTLGTGGVQTLPFHLPWWFPTPTRFTVQALIGPKLSNPVEVWIW